MKITPVALFAYNRPVHLSKTLNHLRLNEGATETILYIFSEGPKPGASDSEVQKIKEVRKIIHAVQGFKEVIVSEASTNKGCANSIVEGVSKVLEKHERVIVLEDDILTHPLFLSFCNAGLELYKDEETIKQIGGFMFPSKSPLPIVLISNINFVWGWATWKRAWVEMDMNAERLLQEIKEKKLEDAFNLQGRYHFLSILEQQIQGKIDAWDICWYASVFLRNGKTILPGNSLTQNIGMDGSGTHFTSIVKNPVTSFRVKADILKYFPTNLTADECVQNNIYDAIRDWNRVSMKSKVRSKLIIIAKRISLIFEQKKA